MAPPSEQKKKKTTTTANTTTNVIHDHGVDNSTPSSPAMTKSQTKRRNRRNRKLAANANSAVTSSPTSRESVFASAAATPLRGSRRDGGNDNEKEKNPGQEGPLIVDGNHERGRSMGSVSRHARFGDRSQGGEQQQHHHHHQRSGPQTRRAPAAAGEESDNTSCTLQAESSSPGTRGRSRYQSPLPPAGFERHGIVFGNHADGDSGDGPSRSGSPGGSGTGPSYHYPMAPDYYHYYGHPQHAMQQMPHPYGYPFYPAHSTYSPWPNPLYAPPHQGGPEIMPPGFAPENAVYSSMPSYYPNPLYYDDSTQPYAAPGDYTPYSSGYSPVNYENETWSRDNGTQLSLSTPNTVDSDKVNLYAQAAGHSTGPADPKESNETNPVAEARSDRQFGGVPAGRDAQPSMTQNNNPLYEPSDASAAPPHPSPPPQQQQTRQRKTKTKKKNTTTLSKEVDDDHLERTSAYLLRIFKSGDFADWQLLLESPVSRFYATSFLVHGLIMARSPCLSARMQSIERAGAQKLLRITTGNSFVQPKAFEIAVQNLYGLPLVSESQLASQLFLSLGYVTGGGGGAGDRDCGGDLPSYHNARMDFALCYAASGAFLANSSIVRRGIQLAGTSINWETVETALRFGLAASSFTLACADGLQQTQLSQPDASDNDSVGSHASDRDDDDDNDNSVPPPPTTTEPTWASSSYFVANTLNQGFVEGSAPEVLRKALEFVAENIPPDFELCPDAQPTAMPSRIPDISGRFSCSASVPGVRFGDFADDMVADTTHLSPECSVTSAIMLSLPFKELRKLFKFVRAKGGKLSREVLQDVVAERERRRLRALRVFNSRGPHGGDDSADGGGRLPDPLGWAEGVRMPADGRSYGQAWIVRCWRGDYTSPLTFGPEKAKSL